MSNLKYDYKLKQKILLLYKNEGRTSKSLSDEYHVPTNTINYWVREYNKECQNVLTKDGKSNLYEDNMRLRKENKELRKENDFLKKATAFFAKETV